MILKESLTNNKRYYGTIKTQGYLAVSIRQQNGRGWYAPRTELSHKVLLKLKDGLNINVSFISDLSKSYGDNNYGKRFLATQVILS